MFPVIKNYLKLFLLLCFLPGVRRLCLATETIEQMEQNTRERQKITETNSGFDKFIDPKNPQSEGSGEEDKYASENASLSYPATTNSTPTVSIANEIVRRINDKPSVNSAINAILVLVVIQTMLGLGCTMDLSLIKEHIYNPASMSVAAICQFGIMPLIAFIMGKIFALDKVAALAVLVTGSCPGGNLSNLLTYFFYGDMNLSILMSTSSTILALVCMPLCLFVYGSAWIEVSTIGRMIPFGGVTLSLILTLIPVGVGIGIKSRFEKIANTLLKISLFSLVVSFIALMTLSIILFGTTLFRAISGASYAIAIIMPSIGYGSGYLLASAFGLSDASRRTVAIETGCQNSQLSSTILKMAFASQTMGAYFLFPIYYALFQGLEGLAMILAFRVYRRYTADERLAPTSRITYDKFDDEIDGEDGRPYGGESYYNSPTPGSGDSLYRIGYDDYVKGDFNPNSGYKLPGENPNPVKERSKTNTPRSESFGDKTSLIPQGSSLNTAGMGSYGGINK